MRKLSLFLTILMTLIVSIMPITAQESNIVEIAVADGRFETLVAAVTAADLAETLQGEGPFTVFAPTDDAFAALPEGTVEALLADIPALTDILLYHVVGGDVMAETVVTLDSATTLQGSDVSITVNDDGVFLNDTVQVIITDIAASNGVIHVIDSVLMPPADDMMDESMDDMDDMDMMEDSVHIRVAHFSPDTPGVDIYVDGEVAIENLEFPTVTDWIELPAGTYNLAVAPAGTSVDDAAIGPADFDLPADAWITVAAVGSLSDGTLAPAVLIEDYSTIEAGNARVAVFHGIEDAPAVDVWANGEVLISRLAFPGSQGSNDGMFIVDVPAGTYDLQVVPTGETEPVVLDLSGTTLEANMNYFVAAVGTLAEPSVALSATNNPLPNIVEIAVADGRFETLVAAVTAADLVETLQGEGPFTVFAPTDDAFAALPEGTVESLLGDIPALTDILLYHVVGGEVMAETVVTLESATTVQGSDVSITVNDEGVFLNDTVQVIITDIQASNGVIHVIDAVLIPPTD